MSEEASRPIEGNKAPATDAVRRAVFLCLIGIALLSVMDALIKDVTARTPVVEAVFLRFAFGLLCALLAALALRPGWPSRETIAANAVRSLVVVATALTFFFALSALPLAEATALSFVAPVFIVLFGMLFLGERPSARVFIAIGLGIAGMLVIVWGRAGSGAYSERALLGAVAAVLSAALFASTVVMLRTRAQRDPVITIVLFHSLGPVLLLAVPAFLVWVEPSPLDLAKFAATGFLGFAGHAALTLAFARAEASRLAPLEYSALVWSSLFGFLAFGEVPALLTVAGAALIVLGTAIAHRR